MLSKTGAEVVSLHCPRRWHKLSLCAVREGGKSSLSALSEKGAKFVSLHCPRRKQKIPVCVAQNMRILSARCLGLCGICNLAEIVSQRCPKGSGNCDSLKIRSGPHLSLVESNKTLRYKTVAIIFLNIAIQISRATSK